MEYPDDWLDELKHRLLRGVSAHCTSANNSTRRNSLTMVCGDGARTTSSNAPGSTKPACQPVAEGDVAVDAAVDAKDDTPGSHTASTRACVNNG